MGISVPQLPIGVIVQRTSSTKDDLPKAYKSDLSGPLDRLRSLLDTSSHWRVTVNTRLHRHAGLGSTTQVVGASLIGAAATTGRTLHLQELFELGVGRVSTVGATLLYSPGCVLEFGYLSSRTALPAEGYSRHPLLQDLYQKPFGAAVRLTPPQEWTIILAIPKAKHSLAGTIEDGFWSTHLPASVESSREIAYETTMRILPGILVGNFNEVLAGLTAVSKQGTKPIEETIQDKQTKLLLKDLRRSYQFASVSSLGPATYTLVEHPPMQAELRHLADHHEEFDFISFPMRGLLDEQNRLTEEE